MARGLKVFSFGPTPDVVSETERPHVCRFCFPHDWSHQILPSSVRAGATRIFTKNVTETVTTAAYDYMNSAGGILNCSYVHWTCTDGSRYHRQACSMPTQYPHRSARFSPTGVSGRPKTGMGTESELGVHARNRVRGVCEPAV